MPTQQDLALARKALDWRMVTREQFEECLAMLEHEPGPKSLGAIFLGKGYITQPQLARLRSSVADVPSVPGPPAPGAAPDVEREVLFGRLALKRGFVTADQIQNCLRLQSERAAAGVQANLGSLLVEQGYMTKAQVKGILADQNKVIVTCQGCGVRYNAPSDRNLPRCPKCGGELAVPARSASLPVVASIRADGSTGDSLIGRDLGGCRIVDFVGRGSMGTVYKARHLALNKHVAIKVLPLSGAGRESITRYIREARSLAKLEHPNIVHVYDVGAAGGVCFIVMQFIQGRPLSALMAGAGLTPPDALAIVKSIAKGLQAAHAKKIVHRDLKPDNVLVTAEREVLITDFGLAQDVEFEKEGEGRKLIVGTPYYIAPEQWQGGPVDGRADLYSLGVIFYTMLAGRRPYDGNRIDEIMRLHLQAPPPAIKESEQITDGMRAVVEKLLAKDPRNRYPSAEELLRDLGMVEKGEDPLALGEFGPMTACEFCGALNPQSAKKCKVCKEEISNDEPLELAPAENEFSCANCGYVQPMGVAKCGRCQVAICEACQKQVAVVKGLCAECLASGAQPKRRSAPPRRAGGPRQRPSGRGLQR